MGQADKKIYLFFGKCIIYVYCIYVHIYLGIRKHRDKWLGDKSNISFVRLAAKSLKVKKIQCIFKLGVHILVKTFKKTSII